MKIIKDYDTFVAETDPIRDYEMSEFDIRPDMGFRHFSPGQLEVLIDFCKAHPQCHIISILRSSVRVNAVVHGALMYELATGNPDPELMLVMRLDNHKTLEDIQLSKFEIDAA